MRSFLEFTACIMRVVAAVVAFVMCQLVVLVALELMGVNYDVYQGLFNTVYSVVLIGVFLLINHLRFWKKKSLTSFGKPEGYESIYAVIIAFGLLGVVSLYMICINLLSEVIPVLANELDKYSSSVDRYTNISADEIPDWDHVINFFSTFMLIPFAEELVFRGIIFGELREKFNLIWSAVITALIFALMHGVSIQMGYAFACGLVLALVYAFTDSIWVSYMVHAAFNLFGSSLATFMDSGIFGDLSELELQYSAIMFEIEFVSILPMILVVVGLGREFPKQHEEVNTLDEQA